MYYVAHGCVPPQRHIQHRSPDGSLYAEELFGMEGFTGRSSILYHVAPPTQTHKVEPVREVELKAVDPGAHRHHLVKTWELEARGDAITRRIPLYFNSDVCSGRPARGADARWDVLPQRDRGRDALRPRGQRRLRHDLRAAPLRPRRLPRAADRDDLAAGPGRGLRAADAVPRGAVRDRAAEALPERLRAAPRARPVLPARPPRARRVAAARRARRLRHPRPTRDRITAYHYRHHPFDLVGWDGYLWPFRFNIGDFQPITGRVHQPPPVHQTFQARNFVVCSFVPRKFDYHPLAIPAPYNHSNINSDEVIYYVAGNFMSRRGVEIASFTLHPAGIPRAAPGHGGGVDRQGGDRGAGGHGRHVPPAQVTQAAMDLDDPNYPFTWLPSEDHAKEASELAERGPEAFPD